MFEFDAPDIGIAESHHVRSLENGSSLDELNPSFLAEGYQPIGHAVDDFILPGTNPLQVDPGFAKGDAHVFGSLCIVNDVGQVEQGFRRYAPAEEAFAARSGFNVHHGYFHAQIRSPEGSSITARPTAYHEEFGLLRQLTHYHKENLLSHAKGAKDRSLCRVSRISCHLDSRGSRGINCGRDLVTPSRDKISHSVRNDILFNV